ncbi:hypothetical protein NBRGN_044_00070 [Nocardia brasiliensis NBRC 14402]|uniref:hypothetical protein n=1 Tax=Nocardia brasiliensis TaxID=37326 RepID=UPI0002F034E3|nr:hypothetical protein [Nocardia brasiliensis]ASF07515.1 hypothetical protein CEQ30_09265 [Nocardia brasiliensis]GAJ81837.1 hypothetical protein NBRGN_044_00070 [Nocardia brasiliensis NBRC 14402]SUB55537.1 Uncharacterised protein [Nocardia brasiliensis]
MVRLSDVVDYDGGMIYLLDHDLDQQTATIRMTAGPRLLPGIGALAIRTRQRQGNLARVSVEMGADLYPPEPVDAQFLEEATYRTERGRQYVGSCYYEHCQGQLADPLTGSGPARVHVRLYEVPGPHEPYRATAPGHADRLIDIDEHVLLHIWNEPLVGNQTRSTRTQLRGIIAADSPPGS